MLIVMRRWLPVVEKRRPLSLLGGESDTDPCVHAVDLVENLAGDPKTGPVPDWSVG